MRILAIVQGIVATLRYGLDREAHADVVTDPRLLILEEGLLATLHTLATSSQLAPRRRRPRTSRPCRRDHVALIEALRAHGLTAASPDDREALEGHVRFKVATDQLHPRVRGELRLRDRRSPRHVQSVGARHGAGRPRRDGRDSRTRGRPMPSEAAIPSSTPSPAARPDPSRGTGPLGLIGMPCYAWPRAGSQVGQQRLGRPRRHAAAEDVLVARYIHRRRARAPERPLASRSDRVGIRSLASASYCPYSASITTVTFRASIASIRGAHTRTWQGRIAHVAQRIDPKTNLVRRLRTRPVRRHTTSGRHGRRGAQVWVASDSATRELALVLRTR